MLIAKSPVVFVSILEGVLFSAIFLEAIMDAVTPPVAASNANPYDGLGDSDHFNASKMVGFLGGFRRMSGDHASEDSLSDPSSFSNQFHNSFGASSYFLSGSFTNYGQVDEFQKNG